MVNISPINGNDGCWVSKNGGLVSAFPPGQVYKRETKRTPIKSAQFPNLFSLIKAGIVGSIATIIAGLTFIGLSPDSSAENDKIQKQAINFLGKQIDDLNESNRLLERSIHSINQANAIERNCYRSDMASNLKVIATLKEGQYVEIHKYGSFTSGVCLNKDDTGLVVKVENGREIKIHFNEIAIIHSYSSKEEAEKNRLKKFLEEQRNLNKQIHELAKEA